MISRTAMIFLYLHYFYKGLLSVSMVVICISTKYEQLHTFDNRNISLKLAGIIRNRSLAESHFGYQNSTGPIRRQHHFGFASTSSAKASLSLAFLGKLYEIGREPYAKGFYFEGFAFYCNIKFWNT